MKDGWRQIAQETRHFIDGEFTAGSSGKVFDNCSPVTGERIGVVHEGLQPEVDAAVKAARAALSGPWGRMSQAESLSVK